MIFARRRRRASRPKRLSPPYLPDERDSQTDVRSL